MQRIVLSFSCLLLLAGVVAAEDRAPEAVYRGELIAYPGSWAFKLPRTAIIVVSDEQLIALTNPEQEVDISLTGTPNVTTLRKVCENAQAAGMRTLVVAFDHFFSQYRKGQEGQPRQLTPDTDAYIQHISVIGKFAQQFGLGLELSLLSPLEIGPGYVRETGESGVWAHYRKGLRDPKTGAFSVELWRQLKWSNNKGPITLEDAGVRVFAFSERALGRAPYRLVAPADIVDISEGVQVEVFEGTLRRAGDYEAVRIRAHGTGHTEVGELNRVLVVQRYRTPEMDYFSERALPYLQQLVDRYADAGVVLNGLYSDEMHIQQDWGYFNHHDNGEFALRYVSPGFAKAYADRYGEEYRDFEKYLVYFVHGQEDFANDLSAKQDIMPVFGDTPEAVRQTALFRSRYYKLLQNGVVDLFAAAKHHAENKMGHRLEARAHATWAQSPTIDDWRGPIHQPAHQYEYTPDFLWSNTVQQAASACYDYFKWGDFLTGNGNDHAEGGWLDRNYYGLMLACSTGILNEVPYSYGAHWGMPGEVSQRRQALVDTFGAAAQPAYAIVQDKEHRDVDVLMLYPLDLVAVDERFGGWMNQYAYANLVTAEKLLERGAVVNGAIEMAGRKFHTLIAQFEPFPTDDLLMMMQALAEQGGRVVWSGPPPLLTPAATPALPRWQSMCGVQYAPQLWEGTQAPGKSVRFDGVLGKVTPQIILSDFVVDHVYPVQPQEGVAPVAYLGENTVGTHRAFPNGGSVTFLGFRPRDDQSQSLGYDPAQWFEILNALGAYPASGAFPEQDNTEYLSRTGPYCCCRFPNGAIAIAPHLKTLVESWPGGFARDPERDREIVAGLKLPSEALELKDFKVNGHTVTYSGHGAVSFRVNQGGVVEAFAGRHVSTITVDGKETLFAEKPLGLIAWAPVSEARRVPEGAVLQVLVHGAGQVRIPAPELSGNVTLIREGATPGSRSETIEGGFAEGVLNFAAEATQGRWLYVVPAS